MQGAYQIIQKASGLAWGGKSGDAPAPPVEGGRRRGRDPADTSRSASTYRGMRINESDHLEVDYNVRTLPTGLEGHTRGCEGYGELTFQSMEKILDELKRLPSHWVLDCSSSFVDIGSGYGKSATWSLATALLALPSASPTGRGLRALSLSLDSDLPQAVDPGLSPSPFPVRRQAGSACRTIRGCEVVYRGGVRPLAPSGDPRTLLLAASPSLL